MRTVLKNGSDHPDGPEARRKRPLAIAGWRRRVQRLSLLRGHPLDLVGAEGRANARMQPTFEGKIVVKDNCHSAAVTATYLGERAGAACRGVGQLAAANTPTVIISYGRLQRSTSSILAEDNFG